jgi:hypothetical protein
MKSSIKRPFKLKWHRYQGVQDLLTIEEFVNPSTEEIDDLDKVIMEAIIETYSREQEDDIGEDVDENIEPPVSISEAICALKTLQRFEIAREDRTQNIKVLDSLVRDSLTLQFSKKNQWTLDNFFVCK